MSEVDSAANPAASVGSPVNIERSAMKGRLPALGEVAVPLRRLVDDVYRSAPDHVQRGLALAVLEDEVPASVRVLGADLAQVLDLLRSQPREERGVVRIEEVLDWSRCVVARHFFATQEPVLTAVRPRTS